MKKCIVLFICSLMFIDTNGMSISQTTLDTVPWNAATPRAGKELDREKYKASHLGRRKEFHPSFRIKLQNNWWTNAISNQWHDKTGFNISYRNFIGANQVFSADKGLPSYFAACATLVGLYDQVVIKQEDLEGRLGYWSQFKSNPLVNIKEEIFQDFKLNYIEMELDIHSIFELSFILDDRGPFIIIPKNYDKALIVAEIDYTTYESEHDDPFRLYYFDPNGEKGKSYLPVRKTQLDESLKDFTLFISNLVDAKDIFSQDEVTKKRKISRIPVYIVYNNNFDKSKGVNLKAVHSEAKLTLLDQIKSEVHKTLDISNNKAFSPEKN